MFRPALLSHSCRDTEVATMVRPPSTDKPDVTRRISFHCNDAVAVGVTKQVLPIVYIVLKAARREHAAWRCPLLY